MRTIVGTRKNFACDLSTTYSIFRLFTKRRQLLREKFKIARDHADFCIENRSWPYFIKARRKGSPS